MLQKPLKPGRRFSRLKLTQAKVATKSDSGPITEVTDELSARSCDPHILTRKTRLRPRNFLINDANGLLQQHRGEADMFPQAIPPRSEANDPDRTSSVHRSSRG